MNKTSKILIFAAIALTLLVFILAIVYPVNRKTKEAAPKTPTAASQEVKQVRPGVIEEGAPTAKKSQNQIDKIINSLPFSQDFRSSTGDTLRVGIVHFSLDPASVLRIVLGGNVNLEETRLPAELKNDPQFPRQIENFRESAQFAFSYIDSRGGDHTKITIDWGSDQANKNAQAWLLPSDNFPAVVKKGDTYVFKQ